jgi:hypothetical protein
MIDVKEGTRNWWRRKNKENDFMFEWWLCVNQEVGI